MDIDSKDIRKKLVDGKILIVLCGPTAVGKTITALNIAARLKTDIISFDSMQVYRGLDIGTDKYRNGGFGDIKQYMIDIFEPSHRSTALEFRNICRDLISFFFRKNKIPVLVGGSGLYLRAVIDDIGFTEKISREEKYRVREKIKDDIKKNGLDNAFEGLKRIDPEYAKKISKNDKKRIIRAREVYLLTGRPFSSFHKDDIKKRKSIYNIIMIGLNADRQYLYQKINDRVANMLEKGLIDEVRSLKEKGFDRYNSMKQAVGYKETLAYLGDENMSLDELKEEISKNTRRLAKKQLTWFREDERINWIRVDDYDNILDLVKEIFKIIEMELS